MSNVPLASNPFLSPNIVEALMRMFSGAPAPSQVDNTPPSVVLGKNGRPLNILPYDQQPGKLGTVEGVDVQKVLANGGRYNGRFDSTPIVQGMPQGIY